MTASFRQMALLLTCRVSGVNKCGTSTWDDTRTTSYSPHTPAEEHRHLSSSTQSPSAPPHHPRDDHLHSSSSSSSPIPTQVELSYPSSIQYGSQSETHRHPSIYHTSRRQRAWSCRGGDGWSTSWSSLFYVFLAVVCLGQVGTSSKEIPFSAPQDKRPRSELSGSTYLMTFGYLPQSSLETGELHGQEVLQSAIRRLQRFAGLPATGIIDDATQSVMRTPRCGLPDVIPRDDSVRRRNRRHRHGGHRQRRYVLGPSTWKKRDLTYRILNYTPDLSVSDARYSIERAFRVWSDATHLTFSERFDGEVDINVRFAHGYHGDGYPFDGHGMTLAHAFFPGEERGGDVHFDEDELWTYQSNEGTNLFTVMAHELGHALGLSHSSVPGALMTPWYQGFNPHLTLHHDDTVAIQSLYGFKPQRTTTTTPPPTTTTTTTTSTTTTRRYPVHRTRRPPVTPRRPAPTSAPAPDFCHTSFDAVAVIRSEIFAFKDEWVWRFDKNSKIVQGFPVEIVRFFYGFPPDVTSIDAVYERYQDQRIVFFKDRRYWVFEGLYVMSGFPTEGRSIMDFGLPRDVAKVDAAFVWGYNLRTYLITGDMYWKYDEINRGMSRDYPRDMSIWKGVPVPVDAAFKSLNGRTYFSRGEDVYEFSDVRMSVLTYGRERIGEKLFRCPTSASDDDDDNDVTATDPQTSSSSSTSYNHGPRHTLHTLAAACLSLLMICAHNQVLL